MMSTADKLKDEDETWDVEVNLWQQFSNEKLSTELLLHKVLNCLPSAATHILQCNHRISITKSKILEWLQSKT